MKLVIGLGNPGIIYRYSRHNVGFQIIDIVAEDCGIKWKLDITHKLYIGKGRFESEEVILAKPISFMNLSGLPVGFLQKKHKINIQDILVIHDDLDLVLGRIRIRLGGNSGGHKGVESIINTLGSSGFARLRFGIGRPDKKSEVSDYVLDRWTHNEKKELAVFFDEAALCCKKWLTLGINKAMNEFNRKNSLLL